MQVPAEARLSTIFGKAAAMSATGAVRRRPRAHQQPSTCEVSSRQPFLVISYGIEYLMLATCETPEPVALGSVHSRSTPDVAPPSGVNPMEVMAGEFHPVGVCAVDTNTGSP